MSIYTQVHHVRRQSAGCDLCVGIHTREIMSQEQSAEHEEVKNTLSRIVEEWGYNCQQSNEE